MQGKGPDNRAIIEEGKDAEVEEEDSQAGRRMQVGMMGQTRGTEWSLVGSWWKNKIRQKSQEEWKCELE